MTAPIRVTHDLSRSPAELRGVLEALAPTLSETYGECTAPAGERAGYVIGVSAGVVVGFRARHHVAALLRAIGHSDAARAIMRPEPSGGTWIAFIHGRDYATLVGVHVVPVTSGGAS